MLKISPILHEIPHLGHISVLMNDFGHFYANLINKNEA
jgi:hypothetical protein